MTRSFGETIYAQQAIKEYAGIREKDSPGESVFLSAYALFKSSGLESAKPALISIVTAHTHEDVAARALYTIGVAYEDKARYDSAVVYYRRIVVEYPYSKYAEYLKPKMLYALQETSKNTAAKPLEVQKTIVTDPNLKVVQDTVLHQPNNQKPAQPIIKDQKPIEQTPPKKK